MYVCTCICSHVHDRQQTLGFKAKSPEATKQKLDEEDLKHRGEKQRKAAIKQEIAEQWGLPWPRVYRKDTRRGGPVPRNLKWEAGLYEWIEKVANDVLPKPQDTPPLPIGFPGRSHIRT